MLRNLRHIDFRQEDWSKANLVEVDIRGLNMRGVNIHPAGNVQDEEKHILNCVIWKMFADHAGHALRVITDQDAEYNFLGEYSEIGGDEYGDIDFDTYLAGWPGTAP